MARKFPGADNVVELLHPGMRPSESPIDLQALSADQFEEIMRRSGAKYLHVAAPSGAERWSTRGVFTTKATQKNEIFTRLALSDANGDEMHCDLSAASCIAMAHHLIEYGIASAGCNGEHAVISDRLMELLSTFLHPDRFAAFKGSLLIACREQLKAEILIEHARTQSSGD